MEDGGGGGTMGGWGGRGGEGVGVIGGPGLVGGGGGGGGYGGDYGGDDDSDGVDVDMHQIWSALQRAPSYQANARPKPPRVRGGAQYNPAPAAAAAAVAPSANPVSPGYYERLTKAGEEGVKRAEVLERRPPQHGINHWDGAGPGPGPGAGAGAQRQPRNSATHDREPWDSANLARNSADYDRERTRPKREARSSAPREPRSSFTLDREPRNGASPTREREPRRSSASPTRDRRSAPLEPRTSATFKREPRRSETFKREPRISAPHVGRGTGAHGSSPRLHLPRPAFGASSTFNDAEAAREEVEAGITADRAHAAYPAHAKVAGVARARVGVKRGAERWRGCAATG